ncbi:DUF6069 family protein [Cryptosporangium aurantiacum]|uniref:Uncharacterized protein n=1 Tax=Cryptosporangium aurantiacum TaxID=134849 RepID=A0A1M7Q3Q8_9ACTN|nr:DUF6069 family protein [Cryptosporangium aurantiacum]SHN24885.1 hypothetical protein SAMN05443668_104102 [Cryptosporangium aurantiacum]
MQPTEPVRPAVDARTLWAGGAAAALVAALVAVVGVVIARGIFDVPVLAPRRAGAFGDASTGTLAVSAAVGALLATALIHLLLISTPRPFVFFGWVVTLVTAVATLVPLSYDADWAPRLATSVIHLVIGIAIGTLVSGVASRSVRMPRRRRPPSGAPGPGRTYPGQPY